MAHTYTKLQEVRNEEPGHSHDRSVVGVQFSLELYMLHQKEPWNSTLAKVRTVKVDFIWLLKVEDVLDARDK